jgi:hypothetical protein
MPPRLLDLFCCAGGAGVGYHRAGYDIVGVDRIPRPNNPHPVLVGDALTMLAHFIATGAVEQFALIHASPPCQAGCALTLGTNQAMGWGGRHEQLIPALRQLLDASGKPYVIEQPNGRAPIRKDLTLCGEMFNLGVIRHRNFELGGWTMPQPVHVRHRGRVRGMRHGQWFEGPYVAAYGDGGGKATIAEMQAAMDIDWTDVREELTEAIPPAYTTHIGRAFLAGAPH